MELTSDQQLAVTHDGADICVVAGPGSGKTRVLVERFAWLIDQGRSLPDRILAITFTERAANEIKRRLASRFAHDPRRCTEIERAYVSTVHGCCTRLLKEHAIAAGLDPEFSVLDEKEAALLLRQSIDAVLDEELVTAPERLRDLYDHWAVADPVAALESVYEAICLSGSSQVPTPPVSIERIVADLRAALAARPPADTPLRRQYVDSVKEWVERASTTQSVGSLDPSITRVQRYSGPLKAPVEAARALVVSAQNAQRVQTLATALAGIQARYAALKRERSTVDFNDLEALTIQILSSDARLRKAVQSRFDYVLMDELQDTNPLQWQLIELIRTEGRFFAVGDINQAIYGFRHATPDAFQSYRNRAPAVVHLRDNFRSTAPILQAACAIATGQAGIEDPDLRARREFSIGAPSVERILIHPQDGDVASLEAQMVCSRIRELVGNFTVETRGGARPAQFRDIAILFRTGKRFPEFEYWLQNWRIPYVLNSGRAFYERQEVLDIVNWMSVLANTLNEIPLAGVLRSPLVGVTDETLLRLRMENVPLIEAVRASADPRLREFIELLDACRSSADDVSPDRLAAQILDASNYEANLDATGRANVRKVLGLMRDQFLKQPAPLATLVERINRIRQVGDEPNAPVAEPGDAIEIMTIHAAKGLEFPIVFLAGLDLIAQRDSAALCYSPAHGIGAKWRWGREENYDQAAALFVESNRARNKEEANRLLYVGLTRAEQKLILSHGPGTSGWVKLLDQVPVTATVTSPSAVSPGDEHATAPIVDAFLDPLPQQGQFDSATTATSVALFADCPRRYLLDRYIGWQRRAAEFDPDNDQSGDWGEFAATEIGQSVHLLLAGETTLAPPEAIRLADVFRASELAGQAEDAARSERELPFVAEFEGTVVNGQIDLWFEDADGITVVDYKTDRLDSSDIKQSAGAYAVQLQIYAAVLERLSGRTPDRGVLHFLRSGTIVEVDLSRAAIAGALEKIGLLRDAQERMDFPLREAEHCKRCPHWRGACPSKYGQEQLGLFDSFEGG